MSNNGHRPVQSERTSRRALGALAVGVAGGALLHTDPRPAAANPSPSLGLLDAASSLGILPSGSADENSAAYTAWANAAIHKSHSLVFDRPGTYRFNAQTLAVPFHRTLAGVDGAVLQCTTGGEWFVGPDPVQGSPFNLENLELDGGSGVDYVVHSAGQANGGPGSAGPTVFMSSVFARNAAKACVRGFNCFFAMRDCRTRGGPIGFLMEGCSESWGDGLSGDTHTDCFVRVRGSHGNPRMPNGGRMSLFRIGAGHPGGYGLDLEGVAQCDVHGITIEGASRAAVRVRAKSSNIRIFGSRSNAGDAIVFDECNNAYLWGGCATGQKVRYLNGATSCRAFVAAESAIDPSDVVQEWGTQPWRGHVRPDGAVLSAQGDAPTDGSWRRADIVWNNQIGAGEPAGWRFSGSSWIAFG